MTFDPWGDLWRDYLREREQREQSDESEPRDPPPAPTSFGSSGGTPYGLGALEDECRDVANTPQGERNERLNKAAFRMGRLIPHEIDATTAHHALAQAGLACGLDDDEIAQVLRHNMTGGLTRGQDAPRQPRERADAPDLTLVPNDAPDASGDVSDDAADESSDDDVDPAEQVRTRHPAIDWRALWDDESEDEWIIPPLIPARRLVALFSAPKVGKSLLMLELAVAIACCLSVLGVTPDRPRRVLYVDFENDPRGDIRDRLEAMGRTPDDLDNLVYLTYPRVPMLDTFAGAAELLAIVEAYGCEVVIIDTISRAVGGEENENDTWLNFYRHTGLALKQAGVTCVRLDHTGKDHDKGMRGGSAKYGDVDVVWKLSRVSETQFDLVCTDRRMPVEPERMILERVEFPYLLHRVEGEGDLSVRATKIGAVVQALDDAKAPNDIGRRRARQVLREMNVSARNTTIDQAVRERRMRPDTLDGLS